MKHNERWAALRTSTLCVAVLVLLLGSALHLTATLLLMKEEKVIRSMQNVDHSFGIVYPCCSQNTKLSALQRAPLMPRLSSADSPKPSVAMCHKSLYGPVNMTRVVQWATYHHDLGFDRIFVWYIPAIALLPGFHDLSNLPFVSMIRNDAGGQPKHYKNTYQMDRDAPGNQMDDIRQCLTDTAALFDWVMMADSDEFLWFRQPMSVKDFIAKQLHPNTTYCSFGKWMYSVKVSVTTNRSLYDLNMNPFTAKSFCNGNHTASHRGDTYCPHYLGRAKILLRPDVHKNELRQVHIHGRKVPTKSDHSVVHFDTRDAHMKEWPGQFDDSSTQELKPPRDFLVTNKKEGDQLGIHSFHKAHKTNPNGTITMYFDNDLEPWLQFVKTQRRLVDVPYE